ncbi:hypothetical protein BVRB_6g139540 [Beta vulgaris subsp. vulgaris]|nr:hypothetical protein BVRB_6g139540 [Beta vulgaris subsp. vulgaris]
MKFVLVVVLCRRYFDRRFAAIPPSPLLLVATLPCVWLSFSLLCFEFLVLCCCFFSLSSDINKLSLNLIVGLN